MSSRNPRPAVILTAVVFTLSCIGFTLFVWNSFGGSLPFRPEGYRFHVIFGADAAQLYPNSDVRISGVNVGKVVVVDRRQEGLDAVIELQSEFAPIPTDARATTRVKTLLGETYVELSPGSSDAPKLEEDAYLPSENVVPAQSLDKILEAFDRPTRTRLKRFLSDFSVALRGRGDEINGALGNVGKTTDDLRLLTELVDRQRANIRATLSDTGEALRAVSANPAQLQQLVRTGNTVFGSLASRERQLSATIDALPDFLDELNRTFASFEETAAEVRPTLAVLRPVAPLVRPALVETSRVAPELRATLRALPPILTQAETALPSLNRLLRQVRPVMQVLYPAGRELVPVVDFAGLYKREIVAGLAGAAASLQGTIARPGKKPLHYLRASLPIFNEFVQGYAKRINTNRFNPYLKPGGLEKLGTGVIDSYLCNHTGNPGPLVPLGGAVPCNVQGPHEVRGESRYFPNLTQDPP